jgi:hypothetical protein
VVDAQKLKRARRRRSLSLVGSLLTVLPVVAITLIPTLGSELSAQMAFVILLALPVFALLWVRANAQVRRMKRER